MVMTTLDEAAAATAARYDSQADKVSSSGCASLLLEMALSLGLCPDGCRGKCVLVQVTTSTPERAMEGRRRRRAGVAFLWARMWMEEEGEEEGRR